MERLQWCVFVVVCLVFVVVFVVFWFCFVRERLTDSSSGCDGGAEFS